MLIWLHRVNGALSRVSWTLTPSVEDPGWNRNQYYTSWMRDPNQSTEPSTLKKKTKILIGCNAELGYYKVNISYWNNDDFDNSVNLIMMDSLTWKMDLYHTNWSYICIERSIASPVSFKTYRYLGMRWNIHMESWYHWKDRITSLT